MAEIKLEPHGDGQDAFNLYVQDQKIGEMVFSIGHDILKVYHTIINDDQQGKGYAKQLLLHMVNYARENGLKVVPICAYVAAQFHAHPDLYTDIWLRKTT